MPALHSLILVEPNDVWLEAMTAAPAMHVNGRAQTTVRLADGDRIRIGSFEMVAHLDVQAATIRDEAAPPPDAADDVEPDQPSELTAQELVERIEAATRLVDEFDQRQRLGVEALLEAADLSTQGLEAAAMQSADTLLPMPGAAERNDNALASEIEGLISQLSGVVAVLEQRSGVQWRHEAGYLDAVSTLFETQDRLSRQLELLLQRVESMNAHRGNSEPGRAIA